MGSGSSGELVGLVRTRSETAADNAERRAKRNRWQQ